MTAEIVARPQLLKPNGEPFTIRDRRAIAKAGAVSGPTPAAIDTAMASEGMGWTSTFGPGRPLNPIWGYSRRPRGFDYPAGVNITTQPRAAYNRPSFDTLRAIINAYDIAQTCIAHKIDSLRSMDLQFKPSDVSEGDVDLPMKAARAALESPDRELPFDLWLAKFMDGVFRYDAGCLYRRRNRAGQVIGLEVVDGTSVTPYIDEHGRKPAPPAPAYAQIIKGIPWDDLTTDDLIYAPFRPQTDSPYGLAPIETILLTANNDLRFQWHMLNYFTAGSMPAGFLTAPTNATTPDQVAEWQAYWDAFMIGDQEAIRQIKLVESTMKFSQARDATFDENFQLALIRRTCAAFGVVPNDLGLTMDVNLANGETQMDVQFRVNDRPVQRFVEKLLTNYLQRDLGLPVKVEFDDGQEKEDRLTEAQAWQVYIETGMASVDEGREALLGLPTDNTRPVPRFYAGGKQGPIPLVDIVAASGPIDPDTAAPADDVPIPAVDFPGGIPGVVPVKLPGQTDFTRAPVDTTGAPEQQTAEIVPPPVAKAATEGVTAATGITGYDLRGAPKDDEDEDDDARGMTGVVKGADELAAFSRFIKARKRDGKWRDFTFTALDPVTAHRYNDRVRSQIRKAAGEIIAAGLAVVAEDSGRVLMLQRGLDPTDPASGMWEFPGGHVETGEDPQAAACREWAEETGLVGVEVAMTSGWTSANGVYQGFVATVPSEDAVPLLNRAAGVNPDDPDGDLVESIAWWDPALLVGNPAVRAELADSLDLVLDALPSSEDVAKAAADAGPKGVHTRWHDAPIRRLDDRAVEFHAVKVKAALASLVDPAALEGLIESYRAVSGG